MYAHILIWTLLTSCVHESLSVWFAAEFRIDSLLNRFEIWIETTLGGCCGNFLRIDPLLNRYWRLKKLNLYCASVMFRTDALERWWVRNSCLYGRGMPVQWWVVWIWDFESMHWSIDGFEIDIRNGLKAWSILVWWWVRNCHSNRCERMVSK